MQRQLGCAGGKDPSHPFPASNKPPFIGTVFLSNGTQILQTSKRPVDHLFIDLLETRFLSTACSIPCTRPKLEARITSVLAIVRALERRSLAPYVSSFFCKSFAPIFGVAFRIFLLRLNTAVE